MEPSPSPGASSSFTDDYVEQLKLHHLEQRVRKELEIDIYLMQLLDGTL